MAMEAENAERYRWTYATKLDPYTKALDRLFFASKYSLRMLRENFEVLIMDCTYKTNKYRMPLLTMVGITSLGTTFFISGAFLSGKRKEDFRWGINRVNVIYTYLHLPKPKVIVYDRDQALINTIEDGLPTEDPYKDNIHVPVILCLWYVQKDFAKYNKAGFSDKDWKQVEKDFNAILYSYTEDIYDLNWGHFQARYSDEYSDIAEYVDTVWLTPYKKMLIRCYTNRILHFGTTTTSRVESAHRALKRQLRFSTSDLKTVVDRVQLMAHEQYDNYEERLAKARSRLPYQLRKPIYRRIASKATPHSLWHVHEQYRKYLRSLPIRNGTLSTPLGPCTGLFHTTMGLLCSHDIAQRLRGQPGAALQLRAIHPYWRYEKPPLAEVNERRAGADDSLYNGPDEDDDALLLELIDIITEPAVIKGKGRLKGSRNKRQRIYKNSSRRELSGFEHVDAEIARSETRLNALRAQRGGRGGQARGGQARGGAQSGPDTTVSSSASQVNTSAAASGLATTAASALALRPARGGSRGRRAWGQGQARGRGQSIRGSALDGTSSASSSQPIRAVATRPVRGVPSSHIFGYQLYAPDRP